MELAIAVLGQLLKCTEILEQEKEARSAGAASRLRSSEGQLREDSQAEEEARGRPSPEGRQEEESPPEIEAREYADGESRGANLLVHIPDR